MNPERSISRSRAYTVFAPTVAFMLAACSVGEARPNNSPDQPANSDGKTLVLPSTGQWDNASELNISIPALAPTPEPQVLRSSAPADPNVNPSHPSSYFLENGQQVPQSAADWVRYARGGNKLLESTLRGYGFDTRTINESNFNCDVPLEEMVSCLTSMGVSREHARQMAGEVGGTFHTLARRGESAIKTDLTIVRQVTDPKNQIDAKTRTIELEQNGKRIVLTFICGNPGQVVIIQQEMPTPAPTLAAPPIARPEAPTAVPPAPPARPIEAPAVPPPPTAVPEARPVAAPPPPPAPVAVPPPPAVSLSEVCIAPDRKAVIINGDRNNISRLPNGAPDVWPVPPGECAPLPPAPQPQPRPFLQLPFGLPQISLPFFRPPEVSLPPVAPPPVNLPPLIPPVITPPNVAICSEVGVGNIGQNCNTPIFINNPTAVPVPAPTPETIIQECEVVNGQLTGFRLLERILSNGLKQLVSRSPFTAPECTPGVAPSPTVPAASPTVPPNPSVTPSAQPSSTATEARFTITSTNTPIMVTATGTVFIPPTGTVPPVPSSTETVIVPTVTATPGRPPTATLEATQTAVATWTRGPNTPTAAPIHPTATSIAPFVTATPGRSQASGGRVY
jgi:hypothetical protein